MIAELLVGDDAAPHSGSRAGQTRAIDSEIWREAAMLTQRSPHQPVTRVENLAPLVQRKRQTNEFLIYRFGPKKTKPTGA